MDTFLKIALLALVLPAALLAGHKGFLFLNNKIHDSHTVAALLFYTLLLFGFLFLLFWGGIYLLIAVFIFLAAPASQ